jgi:hypothetical protein
MPSNDSPAIAIHGPPPLRSLLADLVAIPRDLSPWIAEKHVQYLDDRIHKIDVLSDYLATCDPVAEQRQAFIDFVLGWTRRDEVDLAAYLREYQARYGAVRSGVEEQCDRILSDGSLNEETALVTFWRDFALLNEIDSLHGMFLTSGRWYVNVMLPIVKEIVECSLPVEVQPGQRAHVSYLIARRVITPRFAETPADYPRELERRFTSLFIPVLQYYDRKLLFLFEIMEGVPLPEGYSIGAFASDVVTDPSRYEGLLSIGIYPPFAWHELHASRKPRRPLRPYEEAVRRLMDAVPTESKQRARDALSFLGVMKDYELNYNNYNYKGRFGLVSKFFYWRTAQLVSGAGRSRFLDAILGDRFFEALAVVERALGQTRSR